MPQSPETVVGIPGRWSDRTDIVTSIASRSGGYLFAGTVMIKTGAKGGFSLEIRDHDQKLQNAFSIAGRGRLTVAELEAIGSHTFTLYLLAEGGSVDKARDVLHAAHGLLKSGGIAVKIESTGTAYRADQWAQFCVRDDLRTLLQAYVTYIGGKGVFYSCGMHNLGYPDAIVHDAIAPNVAAQLLHAFVGYLLLENPKLNDRETFSLSTEGPKYRLSHEPCTIHRADHLFHNPYGMWKLG